MDRKVWYSLAMGRSQILLAAAAATLCAQHRLISTGRMPMPAYDVGRTTNWNEELAFTRRRLSISAQADCWVQINELGLIPTIACPLQ